MSIRYFLGGRSAAIAIFYLVEELILYSECRFIDPKSDVGQYHSTFLRETWHKALGVDPPETMLCHLHSAIKDEICYVSKNIRSNFGF